jgi:hypothetical protein
MKGGMRKTATGSSPAVRWRLPSIYDYNQAEIDGYRFVLPPINNYQWSSSVLSSARSNAWIAIGYYSLVSSGTRSSAFPVRCVGR